MKFSKTFPLEISVLIPLNVDPSVINDTRCLAFNGMSITSRYIHFQDGTYFSRFLYSCSGWRFQCTMNLNFDLTCTRYFGGLKPSTLWIIRPLCVLSFGLPRDTSSCGAPVQFFVYVKNSYHRLTYLDN